jgi:thymidylate synthase (FAD)
MVQLRLYSYGPTTVLGNEAVIPPDVFIAIEGLGTFEGVSLEKRMEKLNAEGKDVHRVAVKTHRESTRRGHASITTSLQLMMEVTGCSRALSMLLVAPPFGSYLQESQRRVTVTLDHMAAPPALKHNTVFWKTVEKMVETYSRLIDAGVEIENARYVLPLCTETSLFASCSLENYVAFIQLKHAADWKYVPEEVGVFAEQFEKLARSVAPIMVEARLGFSNRLATYPFPNPYKPNDPLMERLLYENSFPREAKILSFYSALESFPDLRNLLAHQSKESYDSLNPLIFVSTLEPVSLVAYHQSIRHRTVPTAVESIYVAADRALKNAEENIAVPPNIHVNERLRLMFMEAITESLLTYKSLLDEWIARPTRSMFYHKP